MSVMLNGMWRNGKMFDDNYVELNEYIEQIDEAKKKTKGKGKKTEDEAADDAQEFIDSFDNYVE